MMTDQNLQGIYSILSQVPPLPWHFSEGDDFDHWELYSSHPTKGYWMVQDDSGVPPDPGFITYVLCSRKIIEDLLKEVKYLKDQLEKTNER